MSFYFVLKLYLNPFMSVLNFFPLFFFLNKYLFTVVKKMKRVKAGNDVTTTSGSGRSHVSRCNFQKTFKNVQERRETAVSSCPARGNGELTVTFSLDSRRNRRVDPRAHRSRRC